MKVAIEDLMVCHECDALHHLQALPDHAEALCCTCGAVMYRHIPLDAVRQSLALYVSALLLFVIANALPFMSLKLAGHVETDMLLSGPLALFEMGMGGVGLLVLLTSMIFPLLTMLAALYVLVPASLGWRAKGLGRVFRIVQYLMPWSLLGVFMLAVLVAIVKLLDLAEVEIGVAFMAFVVLLPVQIMAQQRFDSALFWPHDFHKDDAVGRHLKRAGEQTVERTVEQTVEQPVERTVEQTVERTGEHGVPASSSVLGRAIHANILHCHSCALSLSFKGRNTVEPMCCPRCDASVHIRKPNSIARTWALLITAILLLFPANMLPIMTVTQLGHREPSTILAGVEHLMAAGMWPLGLIVLVASVIVPVSKLLTLVFLLLSVRMQSTWRPHDRARLYRMTEMIGSWSMVDVFMIGILTSLVSFDALAMIEPGVAASFFAASVVLTMFAAQSFDPRLIWDACGGEQRNERDDREEWKGVLRDG